MRRGTKQHAYEQEGSAPRPAEIYTPFGYASSTMFSDESHYLELAACFVRGHHPDLAGGDPSAILAAAAQRGTRLYPFKRSTELPRVRRILGMVQQLHPDSLLDIGSGRGVFLWPLLDRCPWLPVTAIDANPQRAADLDAVRRGGWAQLQSHCMDGARLDFAAASFDVVTVLEVLEHVADPLPVAREIVRVARGHILASVPSEPDDNPEHIRLFDAPSLVDLFLTAGANQARVEAVRGHLLLFASTL